MGELEVTTAEALPLELVAGLDESLVGAQREGERGGRGRGGLLGALEG